MFLKGECVDFMCCLHYLRMYDCVDFKSWYISGIYENKCVINVFYIERLLHEDIILR